MKKQIHVNQHHIKANGKDGENRPVITVKTYRSNTYGHSVAIHGNSAVTYDPVKGLKCGAKVWIETAARVTVYDADGELVEDLN